MNTAIKCESCHKKIVGEPLVVRNKKRGSSKYKNTYFHQTSIACANAEHVIQVIQHRLRKEKTHD